MSFFFKDLLTGQPEDAHTIKVYAAGTTDLLAGLKKLDGSALTNPFLVSAAGGAGEWGFTPPNQSHYDVYWLEGDVTIAKSQRDEVDGTVFDFNTTLADPAHVKGRTFWNGAKNALSYYNQIAGVAVNLGQELMFPVWNGSGVAIVNGTVVSPDATGIIPADSHHKHKCRLIAVATHDIPDGSWGYVTRIGQVGGLDTSGWAAGQIIYLGSNGAFAMSPPLDGGYSIVVGVVDVVDGAEGIITVDTNITELTVEVTDTNGFPADQKANTTLAVDEVTRTFTIDIISGSEYHFYERGDKYEKENGNTAQSVVFPDIEGEHWFYFSDGILTTQHEPSLSIKEGIILNNAFVCTVYWNATDKKVEIDILEERHGISMPPASHLYLHLTRGAQYLSGLGMSGFTVDADGSLDSHAQFEVAAGAYFDEDITHIIDQAALPASIPVVYNLGADRYIRAETQAGFAVLNAPAGRVYYNQWTGATWQLTQVPNNQFCLYHVFAVNGYDVGLISIMGQAAHATRNAARSAAATEISSIQTNLPFAEFIPLGTFIVQTNDSYANSVKAKVVSTGEGGDYVDWRTSELRQGVAPSSHLNLSDLQLAASGVTWGHITDQVQTLFGLKILREFSESSEVLAFVAGAASLPVATCLNKQSMTLTQEGFITTTGTPVAGKPITLTITHSGGAWPLSWNGTALTILIGADGETERVLVQWNGTAYEFDSIGLVDQTV